MKTVICTTLARPPPARFRTWSICENTCFTCASKLLAMSLPSLSRVAVCPATQTILPPSVMTPGENARESWNGVFSMYSAAVAAIGGETAAASASLVSMRVIASSGTNGVDGCVCRRRGQAGAGATLAQTIVEDKPSGCSSRSSWSTSRRDAPAPAATRDLSVGGGADPASQLLDLSAPGLAFEALFLRAPGRPGRPALPRHGRRARDELAQTRERLLAVALEAAVLLRLDDEDAVPRDALIARVEEPRLPMLGERGGADVEAQVHGRGHLVDVLAACSLRANRADLDLALGNRDCGESPRHGPPLCLAPAAGGERARHHTFDGLEALCAAAYYNVRYNSESPSWPPSSSRKSEIPSG